MSGQIRQAVVLVGGRATRLGSIARETPKPMLEVAGRPFVEHLLDRSAEEGVEDLVLACAHLKERFAERYDGTERGGMRVRCFQEEEPSGTGGALVAMAGILDHRYFLHNGDTLLRSGWSGLAGALDRPGIEAAMAVTEAADAGRYGMVGLDADGLVTGFAEKAGGGGGPVNAGVYALERKALDGLGAPLSLERDVFPALAARGALAGVRVGGGFIDIGVPEDLELAEGFVTGAEGGG